MSIHETIDRVITESLNLNLSATEVQLQLRDQGIEISIQEILTLQDC